MVTSHKDALLSGNCCPDSRVPGERKGDPEVLWSGPPDGSGQILGQGDVLHDLGGNREFCYAHIHGGDGTLVKDQDQPPLPSM